MKLHVNVDHSATLREARGTPYPDPVEVALAAIEGGADGITVHLREDRRHIKDRDVFKMKELITVPLNLEMAATDEMINIALEVRPSISTIVPEKRMEKTTERGLILDGSDLISARKVEILKDAGIMVSFFVDTEFDIIEKAKQMGADRVELHTGPYSLATGRDVDLHLEQIASAASFAVKLGLKVAAGHGLDYKNVRRIALIKNIEELSIGHSIVSRSVLVGMKRAVEEMKELINLEVSH